MKKYLWFFLIPLVFCGVVTMNTEASEKKIDQALLVPFWNSHIQFHESLLFVQPASLEAPREKLLFHATKIISLQRPSTGEIYQQGRDFIYDSTQNQIVLLPGSPIPTMNFSTLYPPRGTTPFHHKDGIHALFHSEGHTFHDNQVEVTYEHSGKDWIEMGGYIPQSASMTLPLTFQKLRDKQSLRVVLLGDSISVGANASGAYGIHVPPLIPPFGNMVVDYLSEQYGNEIVFSNLSVGGMTSSWGVTQVGAVNDLNPDLVLIGFGMNDVNGGVQESDYQTNTQQIIQGIRSAHPNTEFILIATSLANPDWEPMSLSRFRIFRDTLVSLTGPGVALADLTAVWDKILETKSYLSVTGNNINHPNDFGHRLYAQVILGLLTEKGSFSPNGGKWQTY